GQDPATQAMVPLFNPRRQRWSRHFRWSADGLHRVGVTRVGRATVERLALNHWRQVQARARCTRPANRVLDRSGRLKARPASRSPRGAAAPPPVRAAAPPPPPASAGNSASNASAAVVWPSPPSVTARASPPP